MILDIRKVEVGDTDRIADVCSNGWRETVAGKLSETAQRKIVRHWYNHEKVKSDIKKGSYTYAAVADNRVIGVIGGGMAGKNTGHIFVFYIDRNYRYQGIGKKLLRKLTEHQIQKGAEVQRVSVQKDNELGLPFYQAHGFKVVEEVEASTGTDEIQISLKMQRVLDV